MRCGLVLLVLTQPKNHRCIADTHPNRFKLNSIDKPTENKSYLLKPLKIHPTLDPMRMSRFVVAGNRCILLVGQQLLKLSQVSDETAEFYAVELG